MPAAKLFTKIMNPKISVMAALNTHISEPNGKRTVMETLKKVGRTAKEEFNTMANAAGIDIHPVAVRGC